VHKADLYSDIIVHMYYVYIYIYTKFSNISLFVCLPTKTQIFVYYEIGIYIQNMKKYIKIFIPLFAFKHHIRNDPTVASL